MSDHHHSMSEESSLDRNFQIRTNNEGENELYIPCWEEQVSSSTQYHHLIEETKFYKNKCKHLENHLEENHREFSSLNQLYLIAQANERRLLKQNEEIRKINRDLSNELSLVKMSLENSSAEAHLNAKRESDMKERYFKSKEKQNELSNELELIKSQLELLKRKSNQTSTGQDDRWKKLYSEQLAQVEDKWKSGYQELENQFDRKTKQLRQKNQEFKILNKSFNAHKQDNEERIKELEASIQQARRVLVKAKAANLDYQRQIKEYRLTIEQISTKNDDLQKENAKLRAKIKEQSTKYSKLQKQYKQLLTSLQDISKQIDQKRLQTNQSKSLISELRLKLNIIEKEYSQNKAENQRILAKSNGLEKNNLALAAEIQSLKRSYEHQSNKRDSEIVQLKKNSDKKIEDLKKIHQVQKQYLQQSIQTLKRQIAALELRIQSLNNKENSSRRRQSEEQIVALQQQLLSYKDKYEMALRKIKDGEQKITGVRSCDHQDQINLLKQELKRSNQLKEQFKTNNYKLNQTLQELSYKLELADQTIEEMKIENQKLVKEKKKMQDQRERIISRSQRQAIPNENEQKIHELDIKLQEKTNELQIISQKLLQADRQLQLYRSRTRQDNKEQQKDKIKRLQIRIKEKQGEIEGLQIRLEESQNKYEEEKSKLKGIQKQIKSKDAENSKKDKKIKELEKQLAEFIAKIEQYETNIETDQNQIESLRKQIKAEQNLNQKLKLQISKNNNDKENLRNNDFDTERQFEKSRQQLQSKIKLYIIQIRQKDENIEKLIKQVQSLKNQVPSQQSSIKLQVSHIQSSLKERIRQLQQQLKLKDETLKKQSSQSKNQDLPEISLQELEAQYYRELTALKRLIVYKGYKDDEGKRIDDLKADYQAKIQMIFSDYKLMQQEMIILRQDIINQRIVIKNPNVDIGAIEQIWRIKVEQLSEERQILIEKITVWQRKYEQLRYLFEAKLQSKEQTINLLNLKLSNLQLSKGSNYIYPHRC